MNDRLRAPIFKYLEILLAQIRYIVTAAILYAHVQHHARYRRRDLEWLLATTRVLRKNGPPEGRKSGNLK
jgi:hypothetical protein